MQNQLPGTLDVWIGGYLGPSYKVILEGESLVYEVYERAYELFSTERITPGIGDWTRFLTHLDGCGFWQWETVYKDDTASEGTTWYAHINVAGREFTSRGLNVYPPGFVDYLRAMRGLLGGRQFA